eukprot:6198926-Pleurochrysis_carterae.AAC.2
MAASSVRAMAEGWSGSVDAKGLPHGRGTLVLDGVIFEGRMHHGERCGLGTLFVSEADGEVSPACRLNHCKDLPSDRAAARLESSRCRIASAY